MRSVANYVAEVADAGVPVLLYQGLFDWIDGVFSNEQWILDLDWSGKLEFNKGERENWKIDGVLVGFVRKFGPLRQVTIRNAGHSVPLTQPAVAFALAKDFVQEVAVRID
jgi:carboxypeptidase C (cathepsin A)